jgi:flagellar biogenesis protein FliO
MCRIGCIARRTAALGMALPFALAAQPVVPSAPASGPFGNLPLQRDAMGADAMAWTTQLGIAVLLILAAAFACRWLRHRGPLRSGGTLRSISAVRLTPAASVHVVQWGDDEMLIACSGSGVTLLARRPAAVAAETMQATGEAT